MEAAKLLSKRLKAFIDERYNGNINRASFHLDLDYNAVYRIYHDKMSTIPFFIACKILKYTDPGDCKTMLGDLYPGEMETISDLLSGQSSDGIETLARRFERAISSDLHYAIYCLASEPGGLPASIIVKEFGETGNIVASDLVAAGILYEKVPGVFHSLISDKLLRPDIRIVRAHSHRHIDSIDVGTPGMLMENYFGSLNEEGTKAMYRLLEETSQKVVSIFKDQKMQGTGDSIYITSIVAGFLSKVKTKDAQ